MNDQKYCDEWRITYSCLWYSLIEITGFDNDIGWTRLDSVLETYSNLSKGTNDAGSTR